jgi:hypothetical protein
MGYASIDKFGYIIDKWMHDDKVKLRKLSKSFFMPYCYGLTEYGYITNLKDKFNFKSKDAMLISKGLFHYIKKIYPQLHMGHILLDKITEIPYNPMDDTSININYTYTEKIPIEHKMNVTSIDNDTRKSKYKSYTIIKNGKK